MSLTKVTFPMIEGMFKTPEEYGATGGANDTLAVQAAFDSGYNVIFTRSYNVDSVTAGTIGQTIDFNGHGLIGIRASGGGGQYVMAITGREMKIYGMNINANFGGYNCCLRWHSISAGLPAQKNNIYGMNLSRCGIGLLFGQEIGAPSIDAAQSENAVYGFTSYSLQTPFVGNQSNGFITLIAPILDCNPNDWVSQVGYNATTWQTAALTINNIVGQVVIVSGELLKTSTQLGYGIRGLGINILGSTLEIACTQAYVMGSILIRDNNNGYMASDSTNAFLIASGAAGTLHLANISSFRGAGVSSYSGSLFISYEDAASTLTVMIDKGNILEWKVENILGRTVRFSELSLIRTTGDTPIIVTDNNNCLLREKGVDTSIYTTTGWYFTLASGAGSMTIGTAAPTGKNTASLLLVATGTTTTDTADLTSTTTIKNTALKVIPGDTLRITAWAKALAAVNNQFRGVFYDITGTLVSSPTLSSNFTTSWVKYNMTTVVPATAAYFVLRTFVEVDTVNVTDIVVTKISELP